MNIKSSYIKVLVILFAACTFLESQEVTLQECLRRNNNVLYAERIRYKHSPHEYALISLSSDMFYIKNKCRLSDLEGVDTCNIIIDGEHEPIAITQIPHLALDLNHSFVPIPESIGNLKNLEVLNLSYNSVKQLPESLSNLCNLTSLIMQASEIRELPEWIGNLKKLEVLDVSHNALNSPLPDSIGSLHNLRSLNVHCTGLGIHASLPDSMVNLTKLEILYVGGHYLEEFPLIICKLKNLRELYMRVRTPHYSFPMNLPESIGDLTHLEILDLSCNKIEQLPESIGLLENLRELHIDGNQLKELPESIGNLSSIENIFAQNNQLERLPQSIKNLPNLEWIDVEGNNITFPGW